MPDKKNSKKKAAPRKSTSPKKAPDKGTVKKGAAQSLEPVKKAAVQVSETPATSKKKASDFVKRPSHTPAIFKPQSKKPTSILFTIEDIREVLKKRAAEEARDKASKIQAAQAATKAAGFTVVDPTETPRKSKHQAASLEDILGLNPSSGSPLAQQKVPRKFQKYYNLLIELRNEVREEVTLHSSDTLKRSQKDDAGDIAISVDAGTDNFDRDFALSLLSSEQEALNEIEAAITRIHNGTYGTCEVTGEPINDERLEAVPFTRFSVEGQKQHEMNMRKRVSRAGAFLAEASGEKITFGDDDGDN